MEELIASEGTGSKHPEVHVYHVLLVEGERKQRLGFLGTRIDNHSSCLAFTKHPTQKLLTRFGPFLSLVNIDVPTLSQEAGTYLPHVAKMRKSRAGSGQLAWPDISSPNPHAEEGQNPA